VNDEPEDDDTLQEDPGPPPGADLQWQPEIEPANVLVVDDEPANLQAVEAALDGIPAEIISVTSGREALRVLLQHNVALILLDVQLPTLDGFETAQLIRERPRTRHVPIIFLTAYSHNEGDIRKGYELGAVDYLFKPFVPEVLRAKVQAFIDLRNRTAEVRAQAQQLQELERQASERRLRAARQQWEATTLRREMEEQRRINAQLEEADQRKDEFIAVLAHELRNPLAPLVTGLRLIRLDERCTDSIARACEIMNRQVQHLTRLVDDLLDVSRITRGKVELKLAQLDLRTAIEQAVEACTPAADAAKHTLEVSLPDQPLYSYADPARVTQMISNLLSNAVRYTKKGGKLSVEARVDGSEAVILVRDNGQGIAPDMLDRVFEMFVQERIGGSGLGLGLTLVDQVASLHGGRVSARSEGPGQGSEFEVRLPLLPPDQQTDLPSEPSRGHVAASTRQQQALRIVLVEDQEAIAETTQALLEAWGHQVHVANTGRAGIELVASVRPDIALLDIDLPDIDGYQVARGIHERLGEQRPVLVAHTGFGQARDRQRAREGGFDDLMVKPVRPERLLEVLGNVKLTPSA